MSGKNFKERARMFFKEVWKDVISTSWLMFKILIPVSIVVKILKELGVIEWIGQLLAPMMTLVGLPGEMGLVWATGMITNLFGGILAFLQISEGLDMSVAQVTVISAMMLVAHTFPIELQIARKSGVRLWFSFVWRFVFAFLLGMVIHLLYRATGSFTETAVVVWKPEVVSDPSLLQWGLGELKSYAMIMGFIISLIILVKLMRELGIIRLISKALGPVLRWMGIGEGVTTITIIGLTLGIVYGGALIINETRTVKLERRDIFFSLALMGLCHSVIEDTILVLSLGAEIIGVLLIRLVFSILIILLLVRLAKRIPSQTFDRIFMTAASGKEKQKEISKESDAGL